MPRQEPVTPPSSALEPEEPTATAAIGDPSEPDENETDLLLPTLGPVEKATGYRVRKPNGVVVDIPGGIVER